MGVEQGASAERYVRQYSKFLKACHERAGGKNNNFRIFFNYRRNYRCILPILPKIGKRRGKIREKIQNLAHLAIMRRNCDFLHRKCRCRKKKGSIPFLGWLVAMVFNRAKLRRNYQKTHENVQNSQFIFSVWVK